MIESLRAFDIVYVINGGRNGLELLSVLVYDNIVGEASRIGYGSAIAVILLVIALGPDHHLRGADLPEGPVSTAAGTDGPRRERHAAPRLAPAALRRARVPDRRRRCLAGPARCGRVYTSLRPYADTAERGYVSLPATLKLRQLHERVDAGATCRTTSSTR